jgi:DNA-binding NarL/FixJ family response regulator
MSVTVLIADDTESIRKAVKVLLAEESDIRIAGEAVNFEFLGKLVRPMPLRDALHRTTASRVRQCLRLPTHVTVSTEFQYP